MSHQNYFKWTGLIFLIIALVHAWRIVNGLSVTFGGTMIPVGVSWAGVIIGGFFAYQGLKKK